MKILILGAGNLLLSDEGFGVHFVRHLERNFIIPGSIELFDAGTMGLAATHKMEDADRVYIVDAVQAEGEPGTLLRYGKEDFMLKRMPVKTSPHQAGVQEMLLVSEMRGKCPREVFLFGVIPSFTGPGSELSPLLAEKLEGIAVMLVDELRKLTGLSILPRKI